VFARDGTDHVTLSGLGEPRRTFPPACSTPQIPIPKLTAYLWCYYHHHYLARSHSPGESRPFALCSVYVFFLPTYPSPVKYTYILITYLATCLLSHLELIVGGTRQSRTFGFALGSSAGIPIGPTPWRRDGFQVVDSSPPSPILLPPHRRDARVTRVIFS